MLRIDFHIHSVYSGDSLMKLKDISDTLEKRGITSFALTDHNSLKGALEMEKTCPLKFIPGEEIKTLEGEIIGLFLKEEIPSKLTPEETVKRIKSQGGLVYIPHPFDILRRSKIHFNALERIRKDIDIIEVFNARNFRLSDNIKAEEYAKRYNISMAAGSDSHVTWELGICYTEINDFSSPEELVYVLKEGKLVTNRSHPMVHLASTYNKFRKRIDGIFKK